MDMDCNTAKLVEDTFHMARETMGMVKPPRPRTKPVITRGSPHSKKLQAHARIALGNAPATTRSSPGVGLARQQLEQAGRAGTLKGTGEELTAAGFCGGNIRDLEQEQQFTDKYIEPYCQPPPQIVHEQQPPALQSMRCPTVGVLQARKKRPVYLARTVVKVTYPKDEPVTGPLVTRQTMDLREKQSPGKKPWEWGGEEMYPGSSKSQKVINELKLKLTKLQRKLQETRTGAVRSREPTLASQKRYGNLKNPYVPSTRSLVPTRKEQEEQWELAARRRQYAIDRRRRLLEATPTSSPTTTRGAPHDPRPPHGTRSPVGGSPTSYHTANFESPQGHGGSPSSFYSAASQSPTPGTTAASRPIGSPTPFKDVTQQDLQNDQYLREGRQRIIEALRQRQCAAEANPLDVPDIEILDLKYSTQPVAGTNYFFKWTMEQYCYRSGKNSCTKRVNCQATYYVREWENFAELQGPYCSNDIQPGTCIDTTATSRPIGSPTPFKDVTQQDLQNDQYLREGRQRIIEVLRQRQCAAEPNPLDVPDVQILDLKYSTQLVAGTNYFFKWTMEQYCYRSGKNSCIKRVNCQATYYVREWENFAELQGPYCSDSPMTS